MTTGIEAVEAAKRDRRRLRVGVGQSRIRQECLSPHDHDADACSPVPTVVVSTVLLTTRVGRGLTLVDAPTSPPLEPRRRNQISRTEQADLRAALRLHILRGLASGQYASEADAARKLGLSRVWVGSLMIRVPVAA